MTPKKGEEVEEDVLVVWVFGLEGRRHHVFDCFVGFGYQV